MATDIALHMTSKGADRGIIVGTSGTGKSTLAKRLMETYRKENPTGRLLIADTKPRWRATRTLSGLTIAKRYRNMVEGDTIDGVLMDDISQWVLAWDADVNPSHTVIVQPPTDDIYDEDTEVQRQVKIIGRYFQTLNPRQPSMLYIDEGMDFFGPTGNARHGNIIQRCYRAGRERGLLTLMAVQRAACITVQAMSESNVKYVFALEAESDFDILRKKGVPRSMEPVEENYLFRMIRNRKLYPKLLTLKEG